MNSFKLTAALTQYTPLLHFQGRQSGACLRASEVKPKLDKYVFGYLERKRVEPPDGWVVKAADSDRPPSLNYRLRFWETERPTIKVNHPRKDGRRNEIHQLYFGAMGDDNFEDVPGHGLESRVKALTWEDNALRLEILCLAEGTVTLDDENGPLTLLGLLRRLLPPFFALHSFGTRSNKGFGSFAVSELDGGTVSTMTPDALKDCLPRGVTELYWVEYPNLNCPYLDDVVSFSAFMKGGLNFRGVYFKGAIFSFFEGEEYSEKALIKRDLIPNWREDNYVRSQYGITPPNPRSHMLFKRSILGLPQLYEYHGKRKEYTDPSDGRSNWFYYRNGTVTVEDVDAPAARNEGRDYIGRAENPVHFKPYGRFLLMIPYPVNTTMLGHSFNFSVNQNTQCIQAPMSFDVNDFMQHFCEFYRDEAQNQRTRLNRMQNRPRLLEMINNTVTRFRTISFTREEAQP